MNVRKCLGKTLSKIEPTQKIGQFKTDEGEADSDPGDNTTDGRTVEIFGMDIKNFILYSKWSKYFEVKQKKIIAERNQLGMGNKNRKRVKKIPITTTIQYTEINKIKDKVVLLDWNTTYDTKLSATEEDKGDKDLYVQCGGIINNKHEYNPFDQINTNKRSRRLGSQN